MLNSSRGVDETVDLIQQIRNICKAGGFNLMKFASNKIEVIKSIPEEHCRKASTSKRLRVKKYKRKEY